MEMMSRSSVWADAMFIKAECLLRLGGYNDETEQTAADLVTEVRKVL